ncbi:MAG: hypothetical protein U0136_08260 [Bdellovibrionota bacterium]
MRSKITQFNQRGSLALEQVLFIGAIVTMSLGLFAFYDKLSTYFASVDISSLQHTVPGTNAGASNQTAP